MQQQGQHLAELPRYFHALRGPYLKWAQRFGEAAAVNLGHFQRALIALYEARINDDNPYVGDADDYVKQVAELYFTGGIDEAVVAGERLPFAGVSEMQNPLNHLPRPVHLNETQQLMLQRFREMGTSCKEILLMSEYHQLTSGRLAQILQLDGQLLEVEERRKKCLLMVRESWQLAGIMDPTHQPSPVDEDLLDRYYAGELSTTERWDVEARRPGDSVFREAMELREDWADVLIVAGRLDLMETLQREEAKYAKKRPKRAPASAPKKIKLTPRKRPSLGNFKLPQLQSVIAFCLFLALAWLAFTTFGAAAPERKAVAHFEAFPNIFDRYAPRDENERDLKRILWWYDRKDYARAYDELLPVAPAYPAAPLYLGVSALAQEQPSRALDWFDQIETGTYYHPYAEWYEALAYLAAGRKPAATLSLRDISETPGHPYRDRATKLLAEL